MTADVPGVLNKPKSLTKLLQHFLVTDPCDTCLFEMNKVVFIDLLLKHGVGLTAEEKVCVVCSARPFSPQDRSFLGLVKLNRPLPSSKNPHFQNEARCKTFLVKMSFICMRMKNDFHIKGRAPTLVLKQRPGGTRKWPILGFFPIHYVNLVLLEINLPLHKSACFGKKKWIGRLNSETSRTS